MFRTIEGGRLPQAQTKASAGYDVCSNEDVVMHPGDRAAIGLGIMIDPEAINELEADFCGEFATNFYFGLYLRSSMAMRGVSIPNGVGIIDMDYADEIKIVMEVSHSREDPLHIRKGDRVGQLILHRHFGTEILNGMYRTNDDRFGGFGSTGF
ncbi:dUTP diphosphatase [Hydrogenimonas sp.]